MIANLSGNISGVLKQMFPIIEVVSRKYRETR
jgi:hypothetical protein